MIITLSPAKILDFESEVAVNESSQPLFQKEAIELNENLKNKSVDELIDLMKVNPQLAQDTYTYIHSFNEPEAKSRQAIFTYNGIAFQGLDALSLSYEDLSFAQEHLLVLSGLYGMLRPLDMIKAYRLEMQAKLLNEKGKDLYAYWKDVLSSQMSKLLTNDDNVWVNLASKEYDKVIDRKQLSKEVKIITPVFKESSGNTYKQVTVHAKKARGMMARFIIQHQLKDVEHIKGFDTEGYGYSEQLSSDNEWVFIR